jgi:hypothetical protein
VLLWIDHRGLEGRGRGGCSARTRHLRRRRQWRSSLARHDCHRPRLWERHQGEESVGERRGIRDDSCDVWSGVRVGVGRQRRFCRSACVVARATKATHPFKSVKQRSRSTAVESNVRRSTVSEQYTTTQRLNAAHAVCLSAEGMTVRKGETDDFRGAPKLRAHCTSHSHRPIAQCNGGCDVFGVCTEGLFSGFFGLVRSFHQKKLAQKNTHNTIPHTRSAHTSMYAIYSMQRSCGDEKTGYSKLDLVPSSFWWTAVQAYM